MGTHIKVQFLEAGVLYIGHVEADAGISDRDILSRKAGDRSITIDQVVQLGTGGVLHGDVVGVVQTDTVSLLGVSTGEGTAVNDQVVNVSALDSEDGSLPLTLCQEVDVLDGQGPVCRQ